MNIDRRVIGVLCGWALLFSPAAQAQNAPAPPPAVERLGDKLFRIGQIRVDVAKRELTVSGMVNPDVRALEFIANPKDGHKAYESALSLDTNAVTFNAALLMIGLDPKNARNAPTRHFDPATPEGDVVEIWFECQNAACAKTPAERLMYDQQKNEVLSGGAWVYTGSGFFPDGGYMADVQGVLIGFVHEPASIIEYTGKGALNRFGFIVPNPMLGLEARTPIVLTIHAVSSQPR